MFNILVLEDNKDLNLTVCSFLKENGFDAKGCLHVQAAYDAMYNTVFDLIVSDIMLPEIDGYEFVKTVRTLNSEIPILFMTARDDLMSKQRGFRAGIDDYMVKPINLEELVLRTAALNGEEIPLTMREFNLLFKLLSYPRRTFSRQQLMDEFWAADTSSSTRTVDVYMTKLRAKLASCDDFEIQTVHGLGYKAVIK